MKKFEEALLQVTRIENAVISTSGGCQVGAENWHYVFDPPEKGLSWDSTTDE